MRKGDEITVAPDALVAGGDALARVDGLPVFVTGLFPGDVGRVRIIDAKKGFARAELIELVTAGPDRRAEPCSVAGECGGCDWTALRLDRQLEAKKQILLESLRRVGKIGPSGLPPVTLHPSPLNYRIRSRLHRDGDTVGFYALRSNRVVPLASECEVVGIETARRFGSSGSGGAHEGGAAGSAASEIALWEVEGTLVPEEQDIEIRVEEFTYRLRTSSFFQVNRHLLGTMLRLVQQHAARVTARRTAVDLYAGAGFFSLPLARLFDHVIAVEGSRDAAFHARENAPANVRVVNAPVEEWVARLRDASLIFLDPPRAGARPAVIDAAARHAREMVCYLSCDPVTFARDASRLTASGWRLATLDLLDLFPNTHHVETLSSFERAT